MYLYERWIPNDIIDLDWTFGLSLGTTCLEISTSFWTIIFYSYWESSIEYMLSTKSPFLICTLFCRYQLSTLIVMKYCSVKNCKHSYLDKDIILHKVQDRWQYIVLNESFISFRPHQKTIINCEIYKTPTHAIIIDKMSDRISAGQVWRVNEFPPFQSFGPI